MDGTFDYGSETKWVKTTQNVNAWWNHWIAVEWLGTSTLGTSQINPVLFKEDENEYIGEKERFVYKKYWRNWTKKVYHTIIYQLDKDVLDTWCASQHALIQIKKDLTNLKFSYQKNDNAGCYSGNSVAKIMYNKCKNAEH